MKWPNHIRIIPIPWGEQKQDAPRRHQESQEPESGTTQMRRQFGDVLQAIRLGTSCNNRFVEVVASASTGSSRSASTSVIRIRIMIPFERDEADAYWLQSALLDELKEAMAHPTKVRGMALRNALSEAGVQVMYLDRARPKAFGEPDWHEEGRLLL